MKQYKCAHCGKTTRSVQYTQEAYQRPANTDAMPPGWVYVQLRRLNDGTLVSTSWNFREPEGSRVMQVFCSETCLARWFIAHEVVVQAGPWFWYDGWDGRPYVEGADDE